MVNPNPIPAGRSHVVDGHGFQGGSYVFLNWELEDGTIVNISSAILVAPTGDFSYRANPLPQELCGHRLHVVAYAEPASVTPLAETPLSTRCA